MQGKGVHNKYFIMKHSEIHIRFETSPSMFKIGIFFMILMLTEGCASLNTDSEPTQYALYPVHFFRSTISGADGNRCPMYPSCSTYALEAFRKHGALIGWIMTSDRLTRCGRDELKTCPPVRIDGQNHCYDSVNNNDFWWQP